MVVVDLEKNFTVSGYGTPRLLTHRNEKQSGRPAAIFRLVDVRKPVDLGMLDSIDTLLRPA